MVYLRCSIGIKRNMEKTIQVSSSFISAHFTDASSVERDAKKMAKKMVKKETEKYAMHAADRYSGIGASNYEVIFHLLFVSIRTQSNVFRSLEYVRVESAEYGHRGRCTNARICRVGEWTRTVSPNIFSE